MHLGIHVEEPSMEIVLNHLIQKIVPQYITFKVIIYQSKRDLLQKLLKRLRAYNRRMLYENLRIIVLIDEDRQECIELKRYLERVSESVGLITKSATENHGLIQVVNRIVIEELESWFFGDEIALKEAYPKLKRLNISNKKRYRDPDSIQGGTWESLYKILRDFGYLGEVYPKRKVAKRIAPYMGINNNRSQSFNAELSRRCRADGTLVPYGEGPIRLK